MVSGFPIGGKAKEWANAKGAVSKIDIGGEDICTAKKDISRLVGNVVALMDGAAFDSKMRSNSKKLTYAKSAV